MKVSSVNSYNPQMRAYKYCPNRNPIYINPIKYQLDNLFERSINASRRQNLTISDQLKPYLKEISLKNDKLNTYAYDISKNDGQGKYVLFLHGMGQNISASALQVLYSDIINKTEYSVFAPEYRGFGKNAPAGISMQTFLEDTQLALDYMTKDKQIPPENICVIGHSFGGFAASQLTKNNPNLGKLVLVASVDNMENEIMHSAVMKHVSKFALTILKHVSFLRKYLNKLFNTEEQLKKSTVPVDIIHSMNDRVVSYKSAKQIAYNCPNLQSIILLKTGGHTMEPKKIESIISLLQ